MKYYIVVVTVILMSIPTSSVWASFFDQFYIKVNIIDDNGLPVENAKTYISFEKDTMSGPKMYASKGITNSDGEFEASGSGSGHISYGATKEGYYESHYTYDFPGKINKASEKREFKILIRKIENPVPMYARRVRKEIPFAGKEIGFDLLKGDWVVPSGQGQIPDFNVYLKFDETGINDFEYSATIIFNGHFNGFYSYKEDVRHGSEFKLPRFAQLIGYDKTLNVFWRGLKRGSKISWDNNRHYIFRVRSEQENGKVVKAMYGKIFSDIALRSNRQIKRLPSIEFTYYVNPDYTQNLEFDPKRNLFGILPDSERVIRP